MKTLFKLGFITFILWACTSQKETRTDQITKLESSVDSSKILLQVADFPIIVDSTQFIRDLKRIFNIELERDVSNERKEKINTYRKVYLFGSNKEYYFIEYDFTIGSNATFPWKNQLLLSKEGKPLSRLWLETWEFITIFPNQNPFLLGILKSSRGHGKHLLFRTFADTLENICTSYPGSSILTYETGYSGIVFIPNELIFHFSDQNNDGYNDIIFSGDQLMLAVKASDGTYVYSENINGKEVEYSEKNPASRMPLKLIFLYNPKTEHFEAQENYGQKYGWDD